MNALLDQVIQQVFHRRRILRGAGLDAQHMFVALRIHTDGADSVMLAEHHAVDVDHQQVDVIEAPRQQLLQRRFAGGDGLAAYVGLRHAAGLGHLRQHLLVMASGDAAHQHVQHPSAQAAILHGFVGRNRHFLLVLAAQPRPFHSQFALLQTNPSALAPVPDHVRAPLPRRACSRHLLGR
jgi:hypothetical protein